jgi:hypothetical protein
MVFFLFINPYMKSMIDIKNKTVTNEKYSIYATINPDNIRINITNLMDECIRTYYLYHLSFKENRYITEGEANEMIKSVSSTVYLSMSDLYLFYIKMLYEVKTDEDVLGYINRLVKERVLLFITENNKEQ